MALAITLALSAAPGSAAPGADITTAASALERAAEIKKPSPTDVPAVRVPAELEKWLEAGLQTARKEKRPADRARDLAALANSLRHEASLESSPAASPPREVGGVVKKVLADPAYAVQHTAPPTPQKKSWLEILLQRLADLWIKFIGSAADKGMASAGIGDVIAFLAVAAAAIALVYLIVRVALLFAARRARRSGDERAGSEIETIPDSRRTYDEARRAAKGGLYGHAVTLLFQAALIALDRAGRVTYDPARTAGEYRRAVRRDAAQAARPFDDLARAFTDVAYADVSVTERDWLSADASFTAFEPLVGIRR